MIGISFAIGAGAILISIGTFRRESGLILFMQNETYAQTNLEEFKTQFKNTDKQRNPVSDKEALLTLINYTNPIPKTWRMELVELKNAQAVDARAYPSLLKMMDDARAIGLNPLICSSYRSRKRQEQLYQQEIKDYLMQGYNQKEAETEAARWVAVPGTSEHQSGLAVDIVSVENQKLDESQKYTATQQWLMKNSWRYGFILRYPADKSDITKIGYEPWHYRYVGEKAAREIYERNFCLEEYLEDTYEEIKNS